MINKRTISLVVALVLLASLVYSLEIKSGTSEDITLFLKNSSSGQPITGANCTLDVWNPTNSKILDDGNMTELGEGFYYYSTLTIWTALGDYRVMARCGVGTASYYSAMTFEVAGTTVDEWFETINQTTQNTYNYLINTIYPAVDEAESKLDEVLTNTSDIWGKIIKIQNNVTANYNSIAGVQSDMLAMNFSVMNELEDNKIRLISMNNTLNNLYLNITETVNPKLDQLQADVDLIKGYTDDLESGQLNILGNISELQSNITSLLSEISSMQSKIDMINTTTDQVSGYVDTLEESFDCDGSADTPICLRLVEINNTVSTIDTNTDTLESGQTTISGYVDTLESGQAIIISSIDQAKEYLNCTINITNSMCWMLSLVQAYTDTLESGQTTIQNYVDTLEPGQSNIMNNLSAIIDHVDTLKQNQTLMMQSLSLIEGYTDTLETGINYLDSDIQSWSINATDRLDIIDSSLNNIYNDTQEILARGIELDALTNSTIFAIYNDTQELLMQGIEMDAATNATIYSILDVVINSNTTANDIRDYLDGEITDILAEINTTTHEIDDTLIEINETVIQINDTVNEILDVVLDVNSTLDSVYSDTQSIITRWGSYTADQIYSNITGIETKVDDMQVWLDGFNATEQARYSNLISEFGNTKELMDMIRTELGFNGTSHTVYSYMLELDTKLLDINATIMNKIELEANRTISDITAMISQNTTAILSEVGDNSDDLAAILAKWGTSDAISIINNVTENRNRIISIQSWLDAFNTTEELRYNTSQSFMSDVLAWFGILNTTEVQRHNITQNNIDLIYEQINSTKDLANTIITDMAYNGTGAALYSDIAALIDKNNEILALAYEINLTTHNIDATLILMNTTVNFLQADTQDILDKWSVYNISNLISKLDLIDAKIDAIDTSTNNSDVLLAIDALESIVNATRDELDFKGKNITAYEHMVNLEYQLTSVNSSLWIKAASEGNLTRTILIDLISSNVSSIRDELSDASSDISTLIAKWGSYGADDILDNITSSRNSAINFENWMQAYLTGVNGTGQIKYYLENMVLPLIDETKNTSNSIITQLGYFGKNTTVYDEILSLEAQNELISALVEEINLTTHTLDNKMGVINNTLNLAYGDIQSVLSKWENYTASQMWSKLEDIENYVLAINITSVLDCLNGSCNITVDTTDVLQTLGALRDEIGFQNKNRTAYEYFVELESDLLAMDANLDTEIQANHLATRQAIESAIMSNTSEIIYEINQNGNDLNAIITNWGSVSAQSIIDNVTDVRARIIKLSSWMSVFNDTEGQRHNTSQALINDVLNWLGIFNETEELRHNLTQTRIDNTLSASNEIRDITNSIITQIGYNGTSHTAYNDTLQLMNMIAVLTGMVGNITDIDYIDLTAGANAVSLPKRPTNTSIAYLMANISGKFERVDYWDDNDQSWIIYNPAAPFGNTLTNMTTTNVYWIYVNVTSARLHIK